MIGKTQFVRCRRQTIPWSALTRISTVPLLGLSFWSWARLGWWPAASTASVLGRLCLNPQLFLNQEAQKTRPPPTRRPVKSSAPERTSFGLIGMNSRLRVLEAATPVSDLRWLPSNRLESLQGDRKGQFSIRATAAAARGRCRLADFDARRLLFESHPARLLLSSRRHRKDLVELGTP